MSRSETQTKNREKIYEEIRRTDALLEGEYNRTGTDLCRFRWHWTLDESNPDCISFDAYARLVGRANRTISQYAHAYILIQEARPGSLPVGEALQRAHYTIETQAAIESVAQAHGTTFKVAQQSHYDEARRVRNTARERAEARGTSVVEEIPSTTETIVAMGQAKKRDEEEKRKRHTFRFLEVESELRKMREHGLKAMRASEDVAFTEEERQLLAQPLNDTRRMIDVMDSAIIGRRSVNWKEELRIVEGGAAS